MPPLAPSMSRAPVSRIAFYAPLKAPDHPTPSGDRAIARLLIAAWRRQGVQVEGAEVEIASRLRTRIAAPDPGLQEQVAAAAQAEADRLIAEYESRPAGNRPEAWFTYHLYYKAVDWIGPKVAAALRIPYLLAEASQAPKRAAGPWAFNHAGAERAIRAATAIFCLNPADKGCLRPLVPAERLIDLPPFLDLAQYAPLPPDRAQCRRAIADSHNIDPSVSWLLAVGMMRPGDKLASYRQLAEALALAQIRPTAQAQPAPAKPWCLLIVGDGTARPEVEAAFATLRDRVHFLGARAPEDLPACYGAADLLVWPAVNEAFGMALLEAQACALPVLAGAVGGIPAIIRDGETGWLAPPDQPPAFAAAMRRCLDSDLALAGRRARHHIETRHDLPAAAEILGRSWRHLEPVL